MAEQRTEGRTPEQGREQEREQRREQHHAQTWATFCKDVSARGNIDRELAECGAVSVLKRLEQRITDGEAKNFDSQLPFKLRELIAAGRSSGGDFRPRDIHRDEFVRLVADDLKKNEEEAIGIIRAVFATARAHITEGEADKVSSNLPADLRAMWAREV
jgi:uncharacterized protein (DUF2267 family)